MRTALVSNIFVGFSIAQTLVEADVLLATRALTKRDGSETFNMTFFHVNDIHAHLDQFSPSGTSCTDPSKGCYGGMARLKNAVESRRDASSSLWLDAGDEFLGTMYWTYYRSEKITEAVKELNFDAMTLGNHEFDAGDDELGYFIGNISYPVISANIVSDHAVLNRSIVPYKIFWEHEVAVVGATTPTTKSTSNPGPNTDFLDVVSTVQDAIDEILATTNITRIVALTHIGYDEDIRLSRETTGLSLIIGGHSHTLLGPAKDASGPYPTIEKNKDGQEVFVVQAYRWGEYLGHITVSYDSQGVVGYTGGPIHMDSKETIDERFESQIKQWAAPFEAFAAEVVGRSDVDLDNTACKDRDCLLGQVMADAILAYGRGQLSASVGTAAATTTATPSPESGSDVSPDFAIINGGGVRISIPAGPVTRDDVLTAFPFGDSVVQLSYQGSDLRAIFEGIVSEFNPVINKSTSGWIQVSHGIRIEYSRENPQGSRLLSVEIGGAPLDNDREYRVATISYVAQGGDNLVPPQTDFVTLDPIDDLFIQYIGQNSPIKAVVEERIVPAGSNGAAPTHGSDSHLESGGLYLEVTMFKGLSVLVLFALIMGTIVILVV